MLVFVSCVVLAMCCLSVMFAVVRCCCGLFINVRCVLLLSFVVARCWLLFAVRWWLLCAVAG